MKPMRKVQKLQFPEWPLEAGFKSEAIPLELHVQLYSRNYFTLSNCFTYTHTLNLFANFGISLKSGTGRLGTAGVTTLSFAMALQTLGMSSHRLCPDYVLYSLCYQLASCCLFNLQGPLLLTQYLHCLGWIQS